MNRFIGALFLATLLSWSTASAAEDAAHKYEAENILLPNRGTPPPPLDLNLSGKLEWEEYTDRLILRTPKGYVYRVGVQKNNSKLLEKLQNLAGKQVETKGTLFRDKGTATLVLTDASFDSSEKQGTHTVSVKTYDEMVRFKQAIERLEAEYPRAGLQVVSDSNPSFIRIKSDLGKEQLRSLLTEKASYAKLN